MLLFKKSNFHQQLFLNLKDSFVELIQDKNVSPIAQIIIMSEDPIIMSEVSDIVYKNLVNLSLNNYSSQIVEKILEKSKSVRSKLLSLKLL